jgi:hypothetical protein
MLVEEGPSLLDAPHGNQGHLLHSESLPCLQELSGAPHVLECRPIRGYMCLSNSCMSDYAFSVTLQAGSLMRRAYSFRAQRLPVRCLHAPKLYCERAQIMPLHKGLSDKVLVGSAAVHQQPCSSTNGAPDVISRSCLAVFADPYTPVCLVP